MAPERLSTIATWRAAWVRLLRGVRRGLVVARRNLVRRRGARATESARSREQLGRVNAIRKRRAAILLSPLLGHLPGEVQERMESEFGAPATKMTVASALPLFVLGVLGTFAAFARMAGGSAEPLPELPLPLSLYLALESYFRLSSVATESRPMGSIPGTLFYELWRRVRT